MQRVAVVGSGGAGKSALARQIGAITGLPVIHLDHYYWSPGWVPTANDVWVQRLEELLGGPGWVVDGNYGGTLELRADLADTIVFLDLPRRVCITRAMRRVRSPILQAPGCPQKVDVEFLHWIWDFPKVTRPKVLRILGRHAPTTDIVVLRSRADVRSFLSRLRRRTVDLTGVDGDGPDPGLQSARTGSITVHPR